MFCSRTTFPDWSRTNRSLCDAPQLVQVENGDSSETTGAILLFVQLSKPEIYVSVPIPINSTGRPCSLKLSYRSLSCPNRAVQVPQVK